MLQSAGTDEGAPPRRGGMLPSLCFAVPYALVLLLMQYSKHRWVISRPHRIADYVPILHAELSLYLILAAVLILALRRIGITYAALTLYYAVSVFDFASWFTISRPFHPADVTRLIELARYFPQFVAMERGIAVKIVAFGLVPVVTGLAAWWLQRRSRAVAALERAPASKAFVSLGVAYAITLPFVASRGYLQYNSIIRIGQELAYEYRLHHTRVDRADQLRFFGAPRSERSPGDEPAAPARDFNIVLFVIETAPYPYYPDMAKCADIIGIPRSPAIAIANEHYTTYPESDRSFLSMMTGMYPSLEHGAAWVKRFDYGNALPHVLERLGYRSFVLSTAPLAFHDDRSMMEGLGFDDISEMDLTKQAMSIKNGETVWDRSKLYAADLELLDKGLSIVTTHAKDKYLLALLPQASHAPFHPPPDYHGDGSQRSLVEANATWQFELFGRVVARLKETHQLERTIIVVTGDHGLRHPMESPELFPSMELLSSVSYHVPFLIYAGGGTLPPVPVKATSHIDLTPTLLDLMGVPYAAGAYEGRSLFVDVPRSVFFLGGEYQPVSGFKSRGVFCMENRNLGIVATSPAFDFGSPAAKRLDGTPGDGPFDRAAIARDMTLIKALLLQN